MLLAIIFNRYDSQKYFKRAEFIELNRSLGQSKTYEETWSIYNPWSTLVANQMT